MAVKKAGFAIMIAAVCVSGCAATASSAKRGAAQENRLGHNDFRAHLRGRITWVGWLDAERGRRLLATFDQIDWSEGPDR